MRAAGMDRQISIERKTVVLDEAGGEISTWTTYATVFAEVRQTNGREYLAAAQTQSERKVVFFIRWLSGVKVLDRVTYDGRVHNVAEVREIGRHDGVELHTVAGG